MAIRLSGLNSGIDTESIVGALMSAQRAKLTKIESKQTKLEWKQEAWKSLNTKLYDFYKGALATAKSSAAYNSKAVTSSNSSKVTATATNSAVQGSYTVEVESLAKAQYVTGGKVSLATDTGVASDSKTLASLGYSTVDGENEIAITNGDKSAIFTVDADTTVADFKAVCQSIGIEASFDEKDGTFSLGTKSGKEESVEISGDAEFIEKAGLKSGTVDLENFSESVTKKTKLADLGYSTAEGSNVVTIKSGDKTVEFSVTEDSTVNDFVKACQSAGINASFDEGQQRFFLSAKKSGVDSQFEITGDEASLQKLGLTNITGDVLKNGIEENGVGSIVMIAAEDSKIIFNGATLTSDTTSITVNGMTLNLLGTTKGEEINLSVTNDTSAVYDGIKDFLNEYNSILSTLNEKYSAASARDYDVLTDEQKEAMTEDEIEKWENKIKDSLLRKDSTISSLMSSMRNAMAGSYTASNGKTYSLANLGITTSKENYDEGGLLHIVGDEDDTEFAEETNKLQELLNEDPEIVSEVLTGLFSNMYEDMQKKMSSTRLSSALTFYNDKEMNSQLSDYKSEISDWEQKLAEMEERYYAQFTAMEKAMANLNSQQNALAGLLGG